MGSRRVGLLVVAAGLVGACTPLPGPLDALRPDGGAPARFDLDITWEGGAPATDPPLYVFARVEGLRDPAGCADPRHDVEVDRSVCASARDGGSVGPEVSSWGALGPVTYAHGMTLDFGSIPNGCSRWVVIEVRTGVTTLAPVVWYGISERFSLAPNQRSTARVVMTRVPEHPVTGGAVRIQSPRDQGRVPTNDATLELLTDRGVAVMVSNDQNFTTSRCLLLTPDADAGITSLPDAGAPWRGFLLGWSLLACGEGTACPRSVYARFQDRLGYVSDVASASVVVDREWPTATTRVFPEHAKRDDVLTYTAAFSEPLAVPPTLLVTPVGAGPTFLAGSCGADAGVPSPAGDGGVGDQTFFTWCASVGDAVLDGDYAVTVEAVDIAGNTVAIPGKGFSVDRTPPALDGGVLPPMVGLHDTTVRVWFTVNDTLGSHAVAVPGELTPAGACENPDGGPAYTCPFHVSPPDAGRVRQLYYQNVQVSVTDLAGNPAVLNRQVGFDFDPPQPLHGVPTPSHARPGTTVFVVVTTDEAWEEGLAGDGPRLQARQGDVVLPFTYASPGFHYTVGIGDPEGEYALELTASDARGNTAQGVPVPGGTFRVDRTKPSIGQDIRLIDTVRNVEASDDLRLNGSSVLEIRFTASEDLGLPSDRFSVTVGLREPDCQRDPDSPGDGGANPYAYACILQPPDPDDGEGVEVGLPVLIVLQDLAGNLAIGSRKVVYDRKSPRIVNAVGRYFPDARNVLQHVQSAKEGTQVRVTVVMDEPCQVALDTSLLRLRAVNGGQSFDIGLAPQMVVGEALSVMDFSVTVDATHQDGTYGLDLTATDRVGNTRTEPVCTLQAGECTPPLEVTVRVNTPVLTVKQTQVVFLRSPQGATSEEGTLPSMPVLALAPWDTLAMGSTIPLDTFQLEEGLAPTMVRVWERPVGTVQALDGRSLPLAVVVPEEGVWPRRRLGSNDVTALQVTGLDDAGNESQPVAVQWTEWVASANGEPGSNPHVLLATTRTDKAPLVSETPPTRQRVPLPRDRETPVTQSTYDFWQEFNPDVPNAPVGLTEHAAAVDAARGKMVVWGDASGDNGGVGSVTVTAPTWEWNGTSWLSRRSNAAPLARSLSAMAFDSKRGRVVLFGGSTRQVVNDDTWEWDGESWIQRTKVAGGPAARDHHALAYDSTRGKVVMFGGKGETVTLGDTWEWDEATGRWTEPGPLPPSSPSPRFGHAMAFHRGLGVVVLHGGKSSGGTQDDTWTWNGTTWTGPLAGVGTPRRDHGLAEDAERGVLVLYGGTGSAGAGLTDTWEWNETWRRVTTNGPTPGGAYARAMGYLGTRGRVTLVPSRTAAASSGENTLATLGAAWDLTGGLQIPPWEGGGVWADKGTALRQPTARANHGMAHNPSCGLTFVFGGTTSTALGDVLLPNDLWAWNGARWSQVDKSALDNWPADRSWPAMAYNPEDQHIYLYGGFSLVPHRDTWRLDCTGKWTAVNADLGQPLRANPVMSYLPGDGLVMFGGESAAGNADTWLLVGSAWVRQETVAQGPTRRRYATMITMPGEAAVMLHGGSNPANGDNRYGDAWILRRSAPATLTWTRQVHDEIPRSRHAMADLHGRVVVYGGEREAGVPDMQWWTGTAWREVTTFNRIDQRAGHGMVRDVVRNRLIVFGGTNGTNALRDTWELDADAGRLPAFLFQASVGDSGIRAQHVRALRIRGWAGSTVQGLLQQSTGLWAWRTHGDAATGSGTWRELDTCTASLGERGFDDMGQAALDADIPANQVDQFLVRGSGERLYVVAQVRPSVVMGPTVALGGTEPSVGLGYLELRARYCDMPDTDCTLP